MHLHYYCAETGTYELDDSTKHDIDDYIPTTWSDPYSPSSPYSSNDTDSFFGPDNDESESSSGCYQNTFTPRHPETKPLTTTDAHRAYYAPHYDHRTGLNSENYPDSQLRIARSATSSRKLTKPRQVTPPPPDREKRLSTWKLQTATYREIIQASTSPVSPCPSLPHGRHHPLRLNYTRSTSYALQIDTTNNILNDRRGYTDPPSPVSSLSPPQSPLTRSYLRPTFSGTGTGLFTKQYGDDSDKRHASHHQHTPESSPRRPPKRVSVSSARKLTKARPSNLTQKPAQNATNSVFFPSPALSELSPEPLSSIDIASAKLSPEPAPPLTLNEYLTSSQSRHRLSLRELADREHMADLLHGIRPIPLKYIVRATLLLCLNIVVHISLS